MLVLWRLVSHLIVLGVGCSVELRTCLIRVDNVVIVTQRSGVDLKHMGAGNLSSATTHDGLVSLFHVMRIQLFLCLLKLDLDLLRCVSLIKLRVMCDKLGVVSLGSRKQLLIG